MDKLDGYREAIEKIFDKYAAIPYAFGDLSSETVFDRAKDRYLLITFGRDSGKRIHYVVAHTDIVNGKLWIRRDGTEEGIANELVALGVLKKTSCLASSRNGCAGTWSLRLRDMSKMRKTAGGRLASAGLFV